MKKTQEKAWRTLTHQWCFLVLMENLAPHSKQISPSLQGGSLDNISDGKGRGNFFFDLVIITWGTKKFDWDMPNSSSLKLLNLQPKEMKRVICIYHTAGTGMKYKKNRHCATILA